MELRESTTITAKFGPFVDQTDGVTPETGLTLTVKLSKNGGTLTARNSATAITHDADGYYTVELNATDTNTPGRLRATVTNASGHLPVWETFMVVGASYYDDKYGTAILLQAATSTTATLDTGASAVDNFYQGQLLTITAGVGAGQTRRVLSYVGSTKVATLDLPWITNPTSSSAFRLIATGSSALTAVERDAIVTALFDMTDGVETGLTFRNGQRLQSAAAAGKISGATAGAGTVVIRNAVADSKNRISATNDANGNRTAITVDLS